MTPIAYCRRCRAAGPGRVFVRTSGTTLFLVLALGVEFSALAAIYALRNLFPSLETSILKFLIPLAGAWLPLAWAYTFTKVPEAARLAPGRLTVGAAAR